MGCICIDVSRCPPGGVVSDFSDYESHAFEVEDVGDGDFNIKAMVSYTDDPIG